ncbi:MAG: phosphatidylserine decarboxylase [Henriciella sp.]|uniref:phosphatidylserine decarboxylase n=1 Tax=Henriciella sp. TaxID=1968823 RepID=UPI003C71E25B
MAKRGNSMTNRSLPWFQNGFDLEGVVAFLGLWLFGILLGMLWDPLFWFAFIPGVVILFATRTADRVSPEQNGLLLAPCDGVVQSVEDADAPEQLRMMGAYRRVRISSSPFATNNIHAPLSGALNFIEREDGAAENFAALRADSAGLTQLFFSVSGDDGSAGVRVATGGLGPRLHAKADAGDRVDAGRTVAIRRLGGWCDVYVPAGGVPLVEPGQTLIGGESVLWRYGAGAPAAEEYVATEDERTELDADAPITPETTPPPVAEDAEETVQEAKKPSAEPGDPSEMFARLRREATKHSDDPQD